MVHASGLDSNGSAFTVLPTPSITSLSPTTAGFGASVTITGTNFGSTQGTSTVKFNTTTATTVTSWSATSIVATVPTGATTGNVVVTVSGVASNGMAITISSVPPLPAVTQVQPANSSTNVPVNGRVIVRFAQPVQAASVVAGTLSLLQGTTPVAGSETLSSDSLSVTFTPTQSLAALTAYTVAVTDVAAGQSSPMFQSTFTTGSGSDTVNPQVVQTSPQSGDTNIPINAPLMARFTKAMDPGTLTAQNFRVYDSVTGLYLSGMVQVDATGLTASFVPQTPLAVHRSYSVNLTANMQDSSGNSLQGGPTSFSFTTSFAASTHGPTLVGVSPGNGANAIPVNARVVLEFDEPLNVLSVSQGFQVLAAGVPVAGGVALSDGNKRITFTPQTALSPSTTYTVSATAQITDVSALALQNPSNSTFTTGTTSDTTQAQVVTMNPVQNSSGAPTNTVLTLQFNKPINPLTVTSTTFGLFSDNGQIPVLGAIAVSADGRTATFTANPPLLRDTYYLVLATNGITDIEGQTLSYFQTSFTTGSGAATMAPTVSLVSPQNGSMGVPVNARVDVVIELTDKPGDGGEQRDHADSRRNACSRSHCGEQ